MFSGSRNLPVAIIVHLALYYSLKKTPPIYFLVILAVSMLFLLISIGVLRAENPINLGIFITHLFVDSFFILTSSFCVLEAGRSNVPVDFAFLGAFIAWVPSFFFESKYQFMSQLGLNNSAACGLGGQA